MKFILASASPRRRQILKGIIPDFEVIPSFADEKADSSLPPDEIVKLLAREKAKDVLSRNPECVVLGSDTIVYYEGETLGKPKDEREARETLKRLSGKTHSVFTGVCLTNRRKEIVRAAESKVTFFDLTEEFIDDYVRSGSPMDKAGGYGIQDGGVVKSYSGSYTNIVGLPEELVKEMIEEFFKESSKL